MFYNLYPSLPSQVFLVGGLIVAALLFAVFPSAIRVLGVRTWQRAGCLVGIVAFIATPNAKLISRNDSGLFAVLAGCIALIYCCQAMVRQISSCRLQQTLHAYIYRCVPFVRAFGSQQACVWSYPFVFRACWVIGCWNRMVDLSATPLLVLALLSDS